MATIANPVGAFDFAHATDFSGSSFNFDSLDQFDWDSDKATSTGMDPNFLQNYFTTGVEESSKGPGVPQSNTSVGPWTFGHGASTASTASEQPNYAFVGADLPASELHFPFGSTLTDFSNNGGYVSSAEQSTFSMDPFPDADFPEYQSLLAGEKQSGFVGEWQTFPQSSSSVENQGLFSHLSVPSNDPSPFKKPQAKASTSSSSMSNSPADVSPSFSKAPWQSATTPFGLKRRGSSHPQAPAQSPRLPQSPQAAFSQGQDWAQPGYALPDPSLLQQGVLTPTSLHTPSVGFPTHAPPVSPALSHTSSHGMSRTGSNRLKSSRSQSPYLPSHQWAPYSRTSFPQPTRSESGEVTDTERERNRCPHPECGKVFKDLKAHMLTHQNERPEKCPIPSCEYSKKGFSRKYDKNRHTLTHYKGTMVCGFCPGSGSSQEKSFNRADVFKRHLTTVHSVEQNPPNSRKKPSAAAQARSSQKVGEATGSCSICQKVFSNAQDFYEHLEDCVLNVVQKADPSEAINEQLLTSVADDEDVKASLERQNLPTSLDTTMQEYGSGAEEQEEDDDDDDDNNGDSRGAAQSSRRAGQVGSSNINQRGAVSKPGGGSRRNAPGLTFSKGGVPLPRPSRKRRRNYPNSWGCNPEKMKMKKRVLTVWDGQHRLAKDEMMLHSDHEVRLPLPDAGNGAYITDLDVQTLNRAEGFFSATEEERGQWGSLVTNVPDGNGLGQVL
ncbi:MAG: hypothetical protein Q9162_003590 [Coniocarpon cinnabarinum]